MVVLFPLNIFSEVLLLNHMVVLYLIFLGNSLLFSTVATPITFQPTVHESSVFSTSLPILTVCQFIVDNHYERCEIISHWVSDLMNMLVCNVITFRGNFLGQ